jgi:DNA-binding transcriptional LysR family regulator
MVPHRSPGKDGHGVGVRRLRGDDSRAHGDATYAGMGIGLRSKGECIRAEKEGRLERVLPGYRSQPLVVHEFVLKGRVRPPCLAACLDALRAALQELA